jgi:predicted nucleotidyltransferase
MDSVLTLQQRKAARVEEIRVGFERLRKALSDYGRQHGGRFLVYGSAVTGRFHYESDIDILVDFDERRLSAALSFVEDMGADLRLKVDVQPIGWCTPEFVEKVSKTALVLP